MGMTKLNPLLDANINRSALEKLKNWFAETCKNIGLYPCFLSILVLFQLALHILLSWRSNKTYYDINKEELRFKLP